MIEADCGYKQHGSGLLNPDLACGRSHDTMKRYRVLPEDGRIGVCAHCNESVYSCAKARDDKPLLSLNGDLWHIGCFLEWVADDGLWEAIKACGFEEVVNGRGPACLLR